MKVCTGACGTGIHVVRTYQCVRCRCWCRTGLTEVSGTGHWHYTEIPRSVRYGYESLYRYLRYRYPCRTELTEVSGTGHWSCTEITEVSGTGINVVQNLPKRPVPVLMVVSNLPKCPVSVLMSYRTYRSVRYWYYRLLDTYRTEHTLFCVLFKR